MERPVGDKFKINGCVYVVVEDDHGTLYGSCKLCAGCSCDCSMFTEVGGNCDEKLRSDRKSVHFEHFGVDF